MPTENVWNSLPSAKEVMQRVALAEAERASDEMRVKHKADAEKKELIDRLTSRPASPTKRRSSVPP